MPPMLGFLFPVLQAKLSLTPTLIVK